MACTRVPDYFFNAEPLSPDGSFHDFDCYDDYCNDNVCTLQKCMPCKPQRLQDTDAGINMLLRQKDKPCRTSDFDMSDEAPPALECCTHRLQKGNRKFICNFAPSAASCISQCLEMERSRCSSFWKLIDQRPELQSLMREGEFEHINLPHIVEPRKPKDTSYSCLNAEELRAKNKALHDQERDRVNKRNQIMDELQRKAGQPVRQRGKKSNKSKSLMSSCTCLDLPDEDFSQLCLEMNAFDKMVGNPVRTAMNPPSAASLERVEDRSRLSSGERKLSRNPSMDEGQEDEEEDQEGEEENADGEFEEKDHEDEDHEGLPSGESGESLQVAKQ